MYGLSPRSWGLQGTSGHRGRLPSPSGRTGPWKRCTRAAQRSRSPRLVSGLARRPLGASPSVRATVCDLCRPSAALQVSGRCRSCESAFVLPGGGKRCLPHLPSPHLAAPLLRLAEVGAGRPGGLRPGVQSGSAGTAPSGARRPGRGVRPQDGVRRAGRGGRHGPHAHCHAPVDGAARIGRLRRCHG